MRCSPRACSRRRTRSLASGALTTTFTASQGLLLMVPKHVQDRGNSSRGISYYSKDVATHALSIFGDHSDVIAARPGLLLASANVQEIIDLGLSPICRLYKGRYRSCTSLTGSGPPRNPEGTQLVAMKTMLNYWILKPIKVQKNALNLNTQSLGHMQSRYILPGP